METEIPAEARELIGVEKVREYRVTRRDIKQIPTRSITMRNSIERRSTQPMWWRPYSVMFLFLKMFP